MPKYRHNPLCLRVRDTCMEFVINFFSCSNHEQFPTSFPGFLDVLGIYQTWLHHRVLFMSSKSYACLPQKGAQFLIYFHHTKVYTWRHVIVLARACNKLCGFLDPMQSLTLRFMCSTASMGLPSAVLCITSNYGLNHHSTSVNWHRFGKLVDQLQLWNVN